MLSLLFPYPPSLSLRKSFQRQNCLFSFTSFRLCPWRMRFNSHLSSRQVCYGSKLLPSRFSLFPHTTLRSLGRHPSPTLQVSFLQKPYRTTTQVSNMLCSVGSGLVAFEDPSLPGNWCLYQRRVCVCDREKCI